MPLGVRLMANNKVGTPTAVPVQVTTVTLT